MIEMRIDYYDDSLSTIDKVNEVLKEKNLMFVDDGLEHDGWCIFHLKNINESI
jgi:hypothetical protein